MAENKFVVKTVFHDENGDTLLREDYRETREKAQELKDLADFGYAGLFGKDQTKVTTELCRSDTSSRAPFSISAVEFRLPKHVIPLRDDITGTAFENVHNCV